MKFLRYLALLVTLCSVSINCAAAAEKNSVGTVCSGDQNSLDWDTAWQCQSNALAHAPWFVGSASAYTCNTTNAGLIQWTGTAFQACNGNNWGAVDAGNLGAGITLGTSVTANNPQISGDVSSGLYTPLGSTVAITTGGVERLRISSAGYVGIGTTSPRVALDVWSGTLISNDVRLGSASDTIDTQSGNALLVGSSGQAVQINTANAFLRFGGSTTSYPALKRNSANLEVRLADDSGYTGLTAQNGIFNGYVGIGTTAPLYPLVVWGGTFNQLAVDTTYAGSTGVAIRNPGNGTVGIVTSGNEQLQYGGSLYLINNTAIQVDRFTQTGSLGIGTSSPSNMLDVSGGVAIGTGYVGVTTAPANGMIVQGNVGIGTTGPNYPLDVWNTSAGAETIAVNLRNNSGTSGTAVALGFEPFSSNTLTGKISNINRSGVYDLAFSNWNGSALAEHMRIQATGNIGIGTSGPVNLLDVTAGIAIGTAYAGLKTAPSNGAIIQGSVGIGTTGPLSALDVYGGVAIGTAYAGLKTAPSNGALIQGSVGIGTTAPQSTLSVSGSVEIGTNYLGTAAPTNGLLVSGNMGVGVSSPASALDVAGSIYSRSNNAGSATTINWASGNQQYTTASCGSYSFSNMTDGGSYTLLVEGTTSGTCSFSNSDSPTLTFKYPSNHGATTSGTMTLYNFVRLGTYVIITWMPGY